jgi:hypothetical protein
MILYKMGGWMQIVENQCYRVHDRSYGFFPFGIHYKLTLKSFTNMLWVSVLKHKWRHI